jgi:hypothetical protein
MFNTPLPADNYNHRIKINKPNGNHNVGMKKNLKLIKRDRDHK